MNGSIMEKLDICLRIVIYAISLWNLIQKIGWFQQFLRRLKTVAILSILIKGLLRLIALMKSDLNFIVIFRISKWVFLFLKKNFGSTLNVGVEKHRSGQTQDFWDKRRSGQTFFFIFEFFYDFFYTTTSPPLGPVIFLS